MSRQSALVRSGALRSGVWHACRAAGTFVHRAADAMAPAMMEHFARLSESAPRLDGAVTVRDLVVLDHAIGLAAPSPGLAVDHRESETLQVRGAFDGFTDN